MKDWLAQTAVRRLNEIHIVVQPEQIAVAWADESVWTPRSNWIPYIIDKRHFARLVRYKHLWQGVLMPNQWTVWSRKVLKVMIVPIGVDNSV